MEIRLYNKVPIHFKNWTNLSPLKEN